MLGNTRDRALPEAFSSSVKRTRNLIRLYNKHTATKGDITKIALY